MTLSSVIPQITSIFLALNDLENDARVKKDALVGVFLSGVKKASENRLSPLEAKQEYGMATLMDARYKKLFFRDRNNASRAQLALIEKLRVVAKETKQPGPQPALIGTAPISGNLDRIRRITQNAAKVGVDDCPAQKIYKFFGDVEVMEVEPIEYWETSTDHPALKSLAKAVLLPPASSVDSERVASALNNLIGDKRTRMKSDYISKMYYIIFVIMSLI